MTKIDLLKIIPSAFLAILFASCQSKNQLINTDDLKLNSSLFGAQAIEGEAPDFIFQLLYTNNHGFSKQLELIKKLF